MNPKINFIGDPHLGKKFKIGTHHARLNERIDMQFDQFRMELMAPCDVNIMVGDIFDKFVVDHGTLLRTATLYREAAQHNGDTLFILIRGNHDVSRHLDRVSSFQILTELLADVENVIIPQIPGIVYYGDFLMGVIPYSPFNSANKMAAELLESCKDPTVEVDWLDLVVGHWDLDGYGDDFNVIPKELLSQITDTIVTGHVHTPTRLAFDRKTLKPIDLELSAKYEDVLSVRAVGSMQPYSHSEDTEGFLYTTVTLEEFNKNPDIYHDKIVRLDLRQGELLPEEIDCLQFSYRIIDSEMTEDEIQVEIGDFSIKNEFYTVLRLHDVDEEYIDQIWLDFQEVSSDVDSD